MKQVVLLFLLISVLPLSKNERNTDAVPRAAIHFNKPMGKPFFEPPKIPAPDTNQLKQNGWYAAALKNMEHGEYHIHKTKNATTYKHPEILKTGVDKV